MKALTGIHHAFSYCDPSRHSFCLVADTQASAETDAKEYRDQGTRIADLLSDSLPSGTVEQIERRIAYRLTHDQFGRETPKDDGSDFPNFVLYKGAKMAPYTGLTDSIIKTGEPCRTYADVRNSAIRIILTQSGEIIED